jgi:UDP-N-acetylmuramate dehydrogenase
MPDQLASHTTLHLGGPIGELLRFTHRDQWHDITRDARARAVPPLIIGAGSNIIAPDEGYPGPVIRVQARGIRMRHADDARVLVEADAGETLDDLVTFTTAHGLSGIEYLAGIPGTIGAAPVQNTGAYGQQISDTLVAVTVWDWNLNARAALTAAACRLAHRTSMFKANPRWTILTVTLKPTAARAAAPVTYQPLADAMNTPPGSRPPLADAVAAVRADRSRRGLTLPRTGMDARQAGSVFVNPLVNPRQAARIQASNGPVFTDQQGRRRASAGWLLQQAGYSPGSKVGPGLYCSSSRTLTVVARDQATSTRFVSALTALASHARDTTGIELHTEPVIIPAI